MIIAQHGINSLNRQIQSSFLFYTDFSQVDIPLKTDTPLIGEPGVYSSNFYITDVYSSGGPFNSNYAQIHNSSSFPVITVPYEMTEQVEQYTLEFWMKKSSNEGLYFEIPNSNAAAIFISSSTINLQVGSGYTATVYNGTYYYRDTEATKIIRTTDNTNNWVHVAVINTKGSLDLYTNGILRAKFVRAVPIMPSNKKIVLYGTRPSANTLIAYISIRSGNQSNNDESFTVPSQPYL